MKIAPEYSLEASFDRQGGYAKASILLRMLPRPTAIFAANDMIALGVLTAIREAGLSCPDDISVFGFDNQEFAELTNPSLSSVHQPGYQMGATAARLLLDRVSGDVQSPRHIVLETELKIRESVAPPRTGDLTKPGRVAGRSHDQVPGAKFGIRLGIDESPPVMKDLTVDKVPPSGIIFGVVA